MESNIKEKMGEMSKVKITIPVDLHDSIDACVSIRTE